MTSTYTIQRRDTLGKIAKILYGDVSLYQSLANYNGIRNPDLIRVGQVIETPSRTQLLGGRKPPLSPAPAPIGAQGTTTGQGTGTATAPAPQLVPPNGLEEILKTFGDIYHFIQSDGSLNPNWETTCLARAPLPFPIPLAWDPSTSVKNIYCHAKLTKTVCDVFSEIDRRGLRSQIKTYGGCFNFRSKRNGNKLSSHSWGLAIDLNPDSNPMGKPGDMDPHVVEVFRQFQFQWGGGWAGSSKDPMHFQFCTGY